MTGNTVAVVIFLFFIFFAYYKRDMLLKFFSIHASVPSNELQEQLTRTADSIIKRLENEISHLELLLEEAEAKSSQLEKQLAAAEHMLKSINFAELNKKADITPIVKEHQPENEIRQQDDTKSVRDNNSSSEKRSLVVAMADQGYTITEIAKSTGMGKGEIMLLLHLNKK